MKEHGAQIECLLLDDRLEALGEVSGRCLDSSHLRLAERIAVLVRQKTC